jgi:hypothetical protein
MAGREPFDATLLRVVQLVQQFVAHVQDASVSMIDHGSARTVVFTGALAIELDEAQYELRSGPCLDAARSGRTIVVLNSRPGSPYPDFSALARKREILQTVSIGLSALGTVSAGLNMYLTQDQPFDDDAMSRAGTLAGYARAAVAQLTAGDTTAGVTDLADVIASRAAVDRAALLLAERNGYTRDQAIAHLLSRSRSERRPLADVAQSLGSS